MNVEQVDFLAEWLHLALDMPDGFARWQDAFDHVRVQWQLERAQRLLRLTKQSTLAPRDRSLVYHAEGMLHAQRGDWPQAVACLMRAVDLLEDSPHVEDGITVLNDLGMLLRLQGNHAGAWAAHEQALSLAQAIEHPRLIAEGHGQLGLDLEHQDEVNRAIEHFSRALAHYQALHDDEEAARMLNHLGEAHWRNGDLTAATDSLQQARTVLQAGAGDAYMAAQIEGNLGNVAYEANDLDEAEARWRSAMTAMDALGVVFDKIALLNNLGSLAYARRDYQTAADYYLESLSLAEELGDERGVQEALHNLAIVGEHLEDYDEDGHEDSAQHVENPGNR